ncbi:MAG: hypothetical protein WC613_00235 [Candidatus Aenigmatarchaeota archaeon]
MSMKIIKHSPLTFRHDDGTTRIFSGYSLNVHPHGADVYCDGRPTDMCFGEHADVGNIYGAVVEDTRKKVK